MLRATVAGPEDEALLKLAREVDPERAELLLGGLPAGVGQALGVLLGSAYPALTPRLDWQLEALERLAQRGSESEAGREELRRQLFRAAGPLGQPEAARRGLRRAVWAEKARIALRELLPATLGGASVVVTARELSHLADAAFDVALEEAAAQVEARFGPPLRRDSTRASLCVVGLGKLGGLELNAGSDVDVLYLYDTDDGGQQLSLHEHFTRVAQRATATLDEPSEDGLAWRVDLRLRPEGSRGPIVNSLAALERYYESWGRTWERAALLRARPMAGDLGLGEQLLSQVVTPFVFRRNVDPSLATALAELVLQSRAELSSDPARDLKLGPGGIREAEFFVQALQLIWGGREPSLRVSSFRQALARLRARGFVSHREAESVGAAYWLLRRVEHRIQWASGLQTHSIPEAGAELERLARSLGLRHGAELLEALERARRDVAEHFFAALPSAPRPQSPWSQALSLLRAGELAALEVICSEKWGGGEGVEHLAALARRPDGPLGVMTLERLPGFGEQLLEAVAQSAEPEQAVRYLRSFFGRFSVATPYLKLLYDDEQALRRLVGLLGASALVGDALVARPETVDVVLFGGGTAPDVHALVEQELQQSARDPAEDAQEATVGALRRAKRRALVEVAVADLAGGLPTREVTRTLSALADAIVQQTLTLQVGPLGATGLAIIAMGKLGGQDIGYGSDLDILFIHDDAGDAEPGASAERYARIAQRVLRRLSEAHPAGPGYELDTRLRPSGAQGLLVTSLASFARYHGVGPAAARERIGSTGAAWERQALLRARFCAGDAALGARVLEVAAVAAYERGAPPVEEMAHLRLRLQRELGREREGRYDLKTGQGGLLDVEFATQWLQMKHGLDLRVRTQDTVTALEALHRCGYLEQRAYEALRDGYSFLRRLEQRMHVHTGRSGTTLEASSQGLALLARRMGFSEYGPEGAAASLLAHYRSRCRAVRQAFEGVLGVRLAEAPDTRREAPQGAVAAGEGPCEGDAATRRLL